MVVSLEHVVESGNELVSTTESISSDVGLTHIDNSLSLDDLFDELSKETKGKNTENSDDTEFSKIQSTIKNLPKITTQLELQINGQIEQNKASNDKIVRINDPITHIIRKQNQKNKPEDSGDKWFNMKQPEITADIKRDLTVIKHRSALDPKRHYKKDKWEIPKFFQMGTIVEGNTEFYSSRMNKKNRGTTLVDEILKDDESGKYFKRKYAEIQKQKTSGGKKFYKMMKEKRKKY